MSGFGTPAASWPCTRLGDDKADVVCKAIRKPPTPVLGGIGMTERGLHPDLAIAHLDREGRHVVGPEVECAAAFEVEAGVVPMTGQDAVLEAAPLEREAHVRASIVEREDAPTIVDDEDWAMGAMHDESALRLQILEAPRKREIHVRHVHDRTSRRRRRWGRYQKMQSSKLNQ